VELKLFSVELRLFTVELRFFSVELRLFHMNGRREGETHDEVNGFFCSSVRAS
jgi:hypothetical protein